MVAKDLKKSLLKYALIAMTVVAISAFLSLNFMAMGGGNASALSDYAVGEMSSFVSPDQPIPQPSIIYTTGGGDELTLSDFRGQIILVNYWATWCGPCVEEMPSLDILQTQLGGAEFDVVTISIETSVEAPREFYERMELTNLPLIHDITLASFGLIGARGLPVSILYDRQGNEIGRVPGPAKWDSEDAYALINAAIRIY